MLGGLIVGSAAAIAACGGERVNNRVLDGSRSTLVGFLPPSPRGFVWASAKGRTPVTRSELNRSIEGQSFITTPTECVSRVFVLSERPPRVVLRRRI